ncbi:hypothetical protein M231_08069 [Tremella mesenterica]|uniref:Uncharacterized protein n=1 Tax=Tremella mesenterica TaxID=5217 RepID=A0A4Q1BD73_TREME|nr:uncharacterized protein TREMEDRAFT_60881 [Tremella mesenterica DSM 1558]EIW70386.1 hypothetical protein TREMEDRAFT_60881 [Tremella mesenterica DSM 1558]RXK34675.1 hypothetical protein M231_08069 [Tremella mesenterica]
MSFHLFSEDFQGHLELETHTTASPVDKVRLGAAILVGAVEFYSSRRYPSQINSRGGFTLKPGGYLTEDQICEITQHNTPPQDKVTELARIQTMRAGASRVAWLILDPEVFNNLTASDRRLHYNMIRNRTITVQNALSQKDMTITGNWT